MAETIFGNWKRAAAGGDGSGTGCWDRNLALTTVCVIYNLILELGWFLMHLPKGLPADTAAAAAALAPIQKTRPEAKWATTPSSAMPLLLLPTQLSNSPTPTELGHVNDQDYGAMNALPSLAASSPLKWHSGHTGRGKGRAGEGRRGTAVSKVEINSWKF